MVTITPRKHQRAANKLRWQWELAKQQHCPENRDSRAERQDDSVYAHGKAPKRDIV